ncbi:MULTISPECIES: hypothetical protein [Sulfurovum]|uniref:DUF304 domain-containing protein n=1 Tax=Sulfurovum xiamenensis TaxID=3019066 RepID=A0ABT7QRA7_9BACT|nr:MULTISPECIES: hypothetical protein [Sulfurovum]EIF51595.1 hypothetical protein SULAR_01978 [Sulfurovum sp. AR]MDM5263555.1 hypothetical protein [Sulfurovum xiamenensis]
MNDKIREMIEEIDKMKVKLAKEIDKQENHISYEIKNGYVTFEQEVLAKQKENMKNLLTWFREVPFLHLLTAPLIYVMVIPAIIFDVLLFIYQQIAFRIFKFEFIKRSDYMHFDHHYLGYLNAIEKLNCLYCSYFNGLMLYASAISGRTELYFCPIKHAKKVIAQHKYYEEFLSYGDEEDYQEKLKDLRETSQQ